VLRNGVSKPNANKHQPTMERRLMVNVTILHIIVVRRFVGVCTMWSCKIIVHTRDCITRRSIIRFIRRTFVKILHLSAQSSSASLTCIIPCMHKRKNGRTSSSSTKTKHF
jgi:Na+/H+-dicarboxylate symporter